MEKVLIDEIEGLGTHWWFEIYDEIVDSTNIEDKVKRIISEFESQYTRFNDSSELSQLNRDRLFPYPSSEFRKLVEMGKEYYELTSGVFDFTLGDVNISHGYDSNYSFKQHSEDQPQLSEAGSRFSSINITDESISIGNGFSLDFGGYGKGFLIDKIAHYFSSELGLESFIINGGGDIYVTSQEGQPFEILLENPNKLGEYFQKVSLSNQALCSSSSSIRTWSDAMDGRRFSHLIDSEDTDRYIDSSAFVVARSAVLADMLATSLCIKGYDRMYLERTSRKDSFEYLIVDNKNAHASRNFPLVS